MSLARETCELVAAAYGLGLVLEDVRDACDPSGDLPSLDEFRLRLEAGMNELDRLPGAAKLVKELSPIRETLGRAPSSDVDWNGLAGEMLALLRTDVVVRVHRRLRDQLDALLVLLLVDHWEHGRHEPRRAFAYAPWLSVERADVEEMTQSRALNGLVAYVPDPKRWNEWGAGTVRLTVDGRLLAEGLLEGDAEPSHVRAPQTSMPSRVEGAIERLEIQNVFSFGEEVEPIKMGRLNLLIGANGAGKSNILEAIELLASTPRDIQAAIRGAGGIHDVLSRTTKPESFIGSIEAVIGFAHRDVPLRHRLTFASKNQRFEIEDELVASDSPQAGPPLFRGGSHGSTISVWNEATQQRRLEPLRLPTTRSILSELRDPSRYPELADLASFYEGLRSYREPLLGRLAASRAPQPTDLPTDQLLADGSNLALILGRLRLDPPTVRSIVERLRDVYASVTDIETKTEGGTIQVFLQDNGFPLPARRISDGTMRFLCLLVVLCDPSPPPVVLIEEPELGLHPDAIGAVADLLREASERMQLIVTTHSEALVDRFGDTPEVVLVVDKAEPAEGGSTRVRRLEKESLKEWLDKYSLGRLWRMGELGGNRW